MSSPSVGLSKGNEVCGPCKDAGFPNIIATYKAVRAGMSHDGRDHPAMCYSHRMGVTPPYILRANNLSATKKVVRENKEIEVKQDKPKRTKLMNASPSRRYRGMDLEISTVDTSKYIEKYGAPVKYKGHGATERTMTLWKGILALKEGEYLIIETGERNVDSMRSTLQNSMTRMARLTKSDFKVRAVANKLFKHVAMWKVEIKENKI